MAGATGDNYAGAFIAQGPASSFNFGAYGAAYGDMYTNNFGVYGTASGLAGSTNYAGFFNGQVYINGTIYGSDQKLKKNIEDISNAMDLINNLRPRTYYFNDSFPSMHLSNVKQWGLIAQEVAPAWPELVSDNIQPAEYNSEGTLLYDSVHFKGLNYVSIIPILLKGMQEQDAIIDSLNDANFAKQTRLDNLEQRIQQIENILASGNQTNLQFGSNETGRPQTISEPTKNEKQQTTLDQNIPNPFTRSTIIPYQIAKSGQALIQVFNSTGNNVTVLVNENKTPGSYTVKWDAANLPSGVYTYVLYVNGRQVSKRALKLN